MEDGWEHIGDCIDLELYGTWARPSPQLEKPAVASFSNGETKPWNMGEDYGAASCNVLRNGQLECLRQTGDSYVSLKLQKIYIGAQPPPSFSISFSQTTPQIFFDHSGLDRSLEELHISTFDCTPQESYCFHLSLCRHGIRTPNFQSHRVMDAFREHERRHPGHWKTYQGILLEERYSWIPSW